MPNGKLVCVKLTYDSTIERIQITGDFFLHPEEAITDIEDGLVGAYITEPEESLSKRVADVAAEESVEMIGISPGAIAKAVRMAIK